MSNNGIFIVLEGPDRAGKSTQAKNLAEFLAECSIETVHTREPGGTAFAEAIRNILLDPAYEVADISELLLYEAARAQHTEKLIRPALAAGKAVLSERYTMSSLAYQGCGRGIALETIARLNEIATGGLKPDLTLVFLMPDERFSERGQHRRADRLEMEGDAFRLRVREGFKRLAQEDPSAVIINADQTIDNTAAEIRSIVSALPALKNRI